MHIIIPCFQCLASGRVLSLARAEFRDDGKYDLVCTYGHESTTLLQQQRFEILFDIGANAILDGYYREAVTSFAASLERFYEYALRVLLWNASGSDALFKACWKVVSNQSERQLGAFVFQWAAFFNRQPAMLPDASVRFRNAVVHKGKIPTRDEAVAFGTSVLQAARSNLELLQRELPEASKQVIFCHLRDVQGGATVQGVGPATACIHTIISLSVAEPSHNTKDLDGHLEGLATRRALGI